MYHRQNQSQGSGTDVTDGLMTAEEFTDRYVSLSDRLFRVAYHILESEDEAVDAVQDLYVKLWTVRDILDDVRNPLAYCVVLLRNICIDAVRHGGTHTDGLEGDACKLDAQYAQDIQGMG